MPQAENGSETSPNYNLPPPIVESGPDPIGKTPEVVVESPEVERNVKSPKVSKTKTRAVDLKLKKFIAPQSQPVVLSTAITDAPQIAADSDLIEKEWVNMAKRIIEANREDPYKQSNEMTLFKSDYMKKRYNRTLKVSE